MKEKKALTSDDRLVGGRRHGLGRQAAPAPTVAPETGGTPQRRRAGSSGFGSSRLVGLPSPAVDQTPSAGLVRHHHAGGQGRKQRQRQRETRGTSANATMVPPPLANRTDRTCERFGSGAAQ